jgi:hypothetical protein
VDPRFSTEVFAQKPGKPAKVDLKSMPFHPWSFLLCDLCDLCVNPSFWPEFCTKAREGEKADLK